MNEITKRQLNKQLADLALDNFFVTTKSGQSIVNGEAIETNDDKDIIITVKAGSFLASVKDKLSTITALHNEQVVTPGDSRHLHLSTHVRLK